MGHVRTKTMKKTAWVITEKYDSCLGNDAHTNVCEETAIIPSKKPCYKRAAFVTREIKQIQRGSVRGVSIKLQPKETESRDNCVPEVSGLDQAITEVRA